MNSDVTVEQQAMALFNFMLEKHENNKRVGEFSLYDLIEMVKFLTGGGSDAAN